MKNPRQCAAIVHTQTLILENELTGWDREAKDPAPLEFYHETFARFSATIINAEKKTANANIRVNKVPGIAAKTAYAFQKHMDETLKTADENVPLAYTVQFVSGNLKGMTPAEVLLKDPEKGTKTLNSQYKWLQENVKKYPKNQEQMDAILNASELFKAGKLDAEAASSNSRSVIQIFQTGIRPLTRKKREDGKCFVYEMEVLYHIGAVMPVEVMIQNYYAPVIKKDNGTLNVKVSERDDKTVKRNIMNISAEEWEYVLYAMQMSMRTFETVTASHNYTTAGRMDQAQREQWQAQNGQQ